ncbi:FxSxx-COOH cyclophane-containing RiPP peptide [Streptomyces sp. NRRL S-87]|uniref:FxSxx-COOH cyclophane-containing RiPP peptide n=1 Tax=Streptomyces sp. NRRL S-87 TaxID=1463920 RepID=UPI0007C54E4C|nr:FxSxx-COOH cyclophane-containing RiPP peptide [Streptomyces sp. NRRL S-87]
MNTTATRADADKARRVSLADIDVRSVSAEAVLGRVLPSESGRPVQSPIFNSAL